MEAGGVAVALKRASLVRAGAGDPRPAGGLHASGASSTAVAPAELVAERTQRFEGVHLTAHHYPELRAVADAVPESTLRLTPAEVVRQHAADWRSLLVLEGDHSPNR